MRLCNYKSHKRGFCLAAVMLLILGQIIYVNATPDKKQQFITSISTQTELGFLAVMSHRIQFSESGTYFDYVADGGQDILFPFQRFSAEMVLKNRQIVTLLYQPLQLKSSALLNEELEVDNLVFPPGTPMEFLYNFPFWRISWMFDFASGTQDELALGLSLQIRNARIVFRSADGTLYRDNRDIGPVPIVKARAIHHFKSGLWIGAEVDGFYAPISYLNGSDQEVTGAILDASIKAGVPVLRQNSSLFVNVRYLGGGAVGTNTEEKGPGDGYVKNWLNFLTISLGADFSMF